MVLIFSTGVFGQTSETNDDSAQKIVYTAKQNAMRVTVENLRLIPEKDGAFGNGGYHLYIKKIPGIESVMLTETTKDPVGKADSYAYRAAEYNPINGDEIRYLDGKPLVSEWAKYSLIDSTTEKTDFFGDAFHIYIPEKMLYGYSWSRNGEVQIGKGTFINIRTFEKPYGDYTGDYMDSPFMFNLETRKKPKPVVKKEPEPEPTPVVLTDDYNPIASATFEAMSKSIIYSKGPETIIEDIEKILDEVPDKKKLDVVFAIDATGSMRNDLDTLKQKLMPSLLAKFSSNPGARFGLLFYRDYGDSYNYKDLPLKFFDFTSNLQTFTKNLNSVRIFGREGGDIPEAVYEAIYGSAAFYRWRNDVTRIIVLIGDAEPHPTPRGSKKYSKDYVMAVAESKGIVVHSILLPKDK